MAQFQDQRGLPIRQIPPFHQLPPFLEAYLLNNILLVGFLAARFLCFFEVLLDLIIRISLSLAGSCYLPLLSLYFVRKLLISH